MFKIGDSEAINPKNSRASPTPVVEGDRIYVHFGAEGTAALSATGQIVWKTKFDYITQHGSGGSPVVFGDLVILSCDGGDAAFVVALDKQTGKVRWKTWRRQPWDQAYSTPLVIQVGGRDQVVSVGAYRAAAYDVESGKEIWAWLCRRFFKCPAARLRARPRVHRDRISGAVAAGGGAPTEPATSPKHTWRGGSHVARPSRRPRFSSATNCTSSATRAS